jgi:hypothetical protein
LPNEEFWTAKADSVVLRKWHDGCSDTRIALDGLGNKDASFLGFFLQPKAK